MTKTERDRCFLILLGAPAGTVSPDPESAELVVSARSFSEANHAADRLLAAERRSLETYVRWNNDPFIESDAARREIFLFGGSISVVCIEHTDRPADMRATDVV